jgi:uncharacterized protein (DUF1810 family)
LLFTICDDIEEQLDEEIASTPQLERFKTAQEVRSSGFAVALAEMKRGAKRGHWIWYVFPQLAGLGHSILSEKYAIIDISEAEMYLRDAVLRDRLFVITKAVAERLRQGDVGVTALMNSHVDALKLVSSLTLFGTVARSLYSIDPDDDYLAIARVADEVLATAAGQGYPPCQFTLRHLRAWRSD